MLRITPRPTNFSTFSVAWDADRTMEPHAHEDHELNVAVSGSGRYVMGDGSALHFAAGQILLMPGGRMHQLQSDGPLTFRGLLVHPDVFARMAATPDDLARSDTAVSEPNARRLTDLNDPLPPRVVIAPPLYQTLCELHGQAQLESSQPDPWNGESIGHICRLTAVSILRLLHQDARAAQADPVAGRVLNVKAWIDRHFAEAIVLEDLATMAHVSPSHFSAIFRQQIGVAPKAYLLRRRLDQAATLLMQTGLSIVEIAFSVGFNQLAHFNRSFKAHTKLTPGDYRKKHQKEQRKA